MVVTAAALTLGVLAAVDAPDALRDGLTAMCWAAIGVQGHRWYLTSHVSGGARSKNRHERSPDPG